MAWAVFVLDKPNGTLSMKRPEKTEQKTLA